MSSYKFRYGSMLLFSFLCYHSSIYFLTYFLLFVDVNYQTRNKNTCITISSSVTVHLSIFQVELIHTLQFIFVYILHMVNVYVWLLSETGQIL